MIKVGSPTTLSEAVDEDIIDEARAKAHLPMTQSAWHDSVQLTPD
jgi:hypothetical protein